MKHLYSSVSVRIISYVTLGLLIAVPAQAIVWNYSDRDIEVIRLQIEKLDKEIQARGRLGNIARDLVETAGTATYFGLTLPVSVSEIRTPTSTVLTMNNIKDANKITIVLESVATTTLSAQGVIFVQVIESFDNNVWSAAVLDSTTNTGTQNSGLILNGGTATATIRWTPGQLASSTTRFVVSDTAGKYLKVNVWSTSTSSIRAWGYKEVNN